jgi:hypothetical protein
MYKMKRILITIAVLFMASCTNEAPKTNPLKESIRVVDSVMTVSSKRDREQRRATFDSLSNEAFELNKVED